LLLSNFAIFGAEDRRYQRKIKIQLLTYSLIANQFADILDKSHSKLKKLKYLKTTERMDWSALVENDN